MSKLESFNRQRFIITKLQKHACTFADLDQYLLTKNIDDKKYDCDIRTFQRDVKEIETLFGIVIKYNRRDKVYFLEEEAMDEIGVRMLETFDIYKTLNDFDSASKYVHFSKRKAVGGHHIYAILTAIKSRKMISFTHKNFWTGLIKEFKIIPLALKEFNGRWYCIGQIGDKYISWGLDRILEIQITKTKFTYPKAFNLDAMYGNSFGAHSTNDDDPETIVLETSVEKANYFITMPLHSSQIIQEISKQKVSITLTLCPAHDFVMELLSHGADVKIVSPKSLVNHIKADIKKLIDLYK
jgi:proteasome accessory factor B